MTDKAMVVVQAKIQVPAGQVGFLMRHVAESLEISGHFDVHELSFEQVFDEDDEKPADEEPADVVTDGLPSPPIQKPAIEKPANRGEESLLARRYNGGEDDGSYA